MDGFTVIGVRKPSKDGYMYHVVPSKWLIEPKSNEGEYCCPLPLKTSAAVKEIFKKKGDPLNDWDTITVKFIVKSDIKSKLS